MAQETNTPGSSTPDGEFNFQTLNEIIAADPTTGASSATEVAARMNGDTQQSEAQDATGTGDTLDDEEVLVDQKRKRKFGLRAVVAVALTVGVSAIPVVYFGGQYLQSVATHNAAAASAKSDFDHKKTVLKEINTAATKYNPDEKVIGSFKIDADTPTVSDGMDRLLQEVKAADPSLLPSKANKEFSDFTVLQSGIDVGGVQPEDVINVVSEDVNDDGEKEIIAQRAAVTDAGIQARSGSVPSVRESYPPALPLSNTDTIPSPQQSH